jgi:hypothetical protein
MWGAILGVVLGGLITIATTIAVEVLRRPVLSLSKEDPHFKMDYRPGLPFKVARYLRVVLTNKPLARWMVRAPALQCRAVVTFHHRDDGQNVFGRAMEGRWSGSPEPVAAPILDKNGNQQFFMVDFARLNAQSRIDVYPGESTTLDIAVRADDDTDCYGWNNDAYFSNPPWRNPAWKLAPDRYLVKVVVTSSGQKCIGYFRLVNDVAQIDDFRLEAATADEIAKLSR